MSSSEQSCLISSLIRVLSSSAHTHTHTHTHTTHTHSQCAYTQTTGPSVRPHPPDLSRVLVSRRVVSVSLGTPPNSLTVVTASSKSRDFRNREITGSCEMLTQQEFLIACIGCSYHSLFIFVFDCLLPRSSAFLTRFSGHVLDLHWFVAFQVWGEGALLRLWRWVWPLLRGCGPTRGLYKPGLYSKGTRIEVQVSQTIYATNTPLRGRWSETLSAVRRSRWSHGRRGAVISWARWVWLTHGRWAGHPNRRRGSHL